MREADLQDGPEGDKWNKWPDLVLIDGGEAQLNCRRTRRILAEVGAPRSYIVVGMAKSIEREAGGEHFYRQGQAPFRLDAKSPVLYYLQRLSGRGATVFAIGSHRKRRAKALGASPLDEIAEVGAARKKALLSHFGSAKAMTPAREPRRP